MTRISNGPFNIYGSELADYCGKLDVELRSVPAAEAGLSEAFATSFIIDVLRRSAWLRWRFPAALSGNEKSRFCQWLVGPGARKFRLDAAAVRKITGVFRKSPGKKVLDFYVDIPTLQQRFPFGLVPMGRWEFFEHLVSERGVSHPFADQELLWFLLETIADSRQSLALTYLLRPDWQQKCPRALTDPGWRRFTRWVRHEFPAAFRGAQLGRRPPAFVAEEGARGTEVLDHPLGANVLSHFCYTSGIQQAALFTRAALERVGVRTSCRDVPAGVGTELPDRLPWLGLESYPHTIITVPPEPYLASCYERSGLFRRPKVYRVGYWAWELEQVPETWGALATLVDEIWAPTEFVAAAMRAGMPVPAQVMLPGVELGPITPVSRESIGVPPANFLFLFMFDMASQMARKNPLAVIQAFRRAFAPDERATLVIKVSRGDLAPDDLARLRAAADEAGVLLMDQMLSRAEAYGMIAMCDCFVSLHRSEGFGLLLAEAMLLNKPTIATRYSGNLDFMHDGNSLLVDFTMTEILDDRPIYARRNRWAEPSTEHAATLMRRVFENPEDAKALGESAQKELREKLSLRAAGERMANRLREISELVR